jgi:hypothetical protein
MALDEKSLRKPGFAPGTKVTLADGQEWMLPKPKLRFKPKIIKCRAVKFWDKNEKRLEMPVQIHYVLRIESFAEF